MKPLQVKEKNPNWQGGKSFEKYGIGFNIKLKNLIRERDDYVCQICNTTQESVKSCLSVHHIDYNKKSNSPYNLISLCKNCHTKTNFNRKYWKKYFNEKKIDNYNKKYTIDIMIATKNRPTELALLLQSLTHQTFQKWNLYILDDASETHIINFYFIDSLLTRLKLGNHKVTILKNDFSQGCCHARNILIDKVNEHGEGNLCLRLDDDCLPESDYFQKLIDVIDMGYDMSTGVIPQINQPEIIREAKYLNPIMNTHKFDKEGNIIRQDDECGFCYDEEIIIPTHQFRTNALMKSEILKYVKYPSILSTVAFREEGFYSFATILKGYKIGVNTQAKCFHFAAPGGGNRRPDYSECVQQDDAQFKKWCKQKFQKYGDFLTCYSEQFK